MHKSVVDLDEFFMKSKGIQKWQKLGWMECI